VKLESGLGLSCWSICKLSRIFDLRKVLTDGGLSLDCGKRPGIKAVDGMRRCRVLLGHPSRNALDFRLLAQVEVCPPVSVDLRMLTVES
jgi:hypothetical protein